ncbi:phospho-acceptor domain-containing protein [Spirosoma oryzae]|uniref:histidine kinase n=1 Tax=Spirosoma oryzae TaxID=1469603 RepID=A0A2T0SPT3_9BACT|nr:ATP-binding protein [Spirosoma oryzae]PRY35429.1 phospho-acceptor domain-containing protein [Spirosoma oryzae]
MKSLFSEQTLIPFLEQFDFSLVLRADSPQYTILVVSDQAEQLLGYQRAQLVGKSLTDGFSNAPIDPIGNASFQQTLVAVIRDRQPRTLPTYEQPSSTGTGSIYLKKVLKPIVDTHQQVAYVLVTTVDITQQVLAQQAAEQSEQRLRAVIRQAPVAIALYRMPDMVLELANERMLALWNKSAAIIGSPLADIVTSDELQDIQPIVKAVFTSGIPYYGTHFPSTVQPDDPGAGPFFDLVYSPVRDCHNTTTSVLSIITDITQQVLASQALKASEQRLQGLIDESPMAIAVYKGRDMTIELANEAMLFIWGKSASVIGQPLATALPELQGQPFLKQLDDVYTTGIAYHAREAPATLQVDEKLVTSHFNFTYKPLVDATGEVYAILNVAIDVEESVMNRWHLQESEDRYRQLAAQLEERVQQRTQELDAMNEVLRRSNENLEQFAYIASHDLQEPLRKIQQFGDLLLNQYQEQLGTGVDYLQRMQLAAWRMSTLIRELLSFSRISTSNHQHWDQQVALGALIASIEDDLSVAIQESGTVIESDTLPTVQGDELQLRQLFQNLLSNAIKFRRPGVVPHIRLVCAIVSAEQLPGNTVPVSREGQFYCIDVRDNGIGFDEKYLDRIFQAFQRLHTKQQYQGTGIGLAICEKVVANHGGAIRASSQPGQGATFSIYLPVNDPRQPATVRLH